MKTKKTKEELVLLPEIDFPESRTKRPSNDGAEKWLGQPIQCLDNGFVYLVDYMGNDLSVEQAARVSYGAGTRKVSETTGLIRTLRREDHTTPFEMAEIKLHARMPIFVARQWVRHRTASINEYSARYSIVPDEFYLVEPENLAEQSKDNRQGRGTVVPAEYAEVVREKMTEVAGIEYDAYKWLLNDNGKREPVDPERPMISREIARGLLGTFFYTEWYWKTDIHNCFHFLKLRMDKHAQYEVRVYANAMAKIISESFPITWKAFEDYELNAIRFSAPEMKIIGELLEKQNVRFGLNDLMEAAKNSGMSSKREREGMVEKLKQFGLKIEE